MKRSEMIELMVKEDKVRRQFMKYEGEYVRMDNLLKLVELMGMLPPTIFKEKFVDCGNGQGFTTYEQNEWEPENTCNVCGTGIHEGVICESCYEDH